jgi:hypothetical protein
VEVEPQDLAGVQRHGRHAPTLEVRGRRAGAPGEAGVELARQVADEQRVVADDV